MHAGPLRDDDDDRPTGRQAGACTDAGIEWIGIGCTHRMQGPRPSGRPQLCFLLQCKVLDLSVPEKKKVILIFRRINNSKLLSVISNKLYISIKSFNKNGKISV